jgi:hypothetical protein
VSVDDRLCTKASINAYFEKIRVNSGRLYDLSVKKVCLICNFSLDTPLSQLGRDQRALYLTYPPVSTMQDLLNIADVGNQLVSPDRQLSPLFNNSTWTTQKYGPDLYAASVTLSSLASVDGSSNNDLLRGNGVKILGFGAQDELFGGAGGDFLDAGDGDDRLFGDGGKDWLLGRSGQDQLWGGLGGDYLDGGDGEDRLYGEAGRDWLLGGDGQDQLFGGDGTDILNGNQGDNRLTGGKGSDVFVIGRSGKSWVEDFQVGVDRLALDGLTFEQLRIFNQNGEAWITTLDNQPVAFLKGVDAGLLSVKDFADVSITAVLGNVEADWAKAFEDYTKNGGFGNGAFTVGQSGQVSIDYLFDGSGYEGQLAIFSLTGMEGFLQGDPDAFMQEVARRALSNSGLGYTVIFDLVEGARFSGEVGYEGNFNGGQYLGAKAFSMRPGEKFAVMLVPNGKVEDVRDNGLGLGGGSTPMFSIASLNLGRSSQLAQVIEAKADDKSFAFEDAGLWGSSDRDFNDVVFQMKGAVGSSLLLDSVIAPGKEWRSSVVGQQLEQFTVEPIDLAGNTIPDARRTNLSSFGKTYRGWVGSIDPIDYYSFILGANNEFKLSLDGLAANADVELLDFRGNVVANSVNPGKMTELIATNLPAGVYRLRVTSADTLGTSYNLDVSTQAFIDGLTTTGSTRLESLNTFQSIPLINADKFGNTAVNLDSRFTGINGQGWSVVIIDSDINLNHPFFGPDSDNNGIADRIVFSMDFSDPNKLLVGANGQNNDLDNDGLPDGAANANGVKPDGTPNASNHGTNVSSIVASSDTEFRGLAPGANIIHLKVFPDGDKTTAEDGDIEQALNWVAENAARFDIASVNLSLGSGNVNSPQSSSLGDEFQILSNLGIIVVTSSGNDFFTFGSAQGVNTLSSDPNVLSIGAVFDSDVGPYGRIDDGDGDGIPETIRDDISRFAYTTGADRITPFSQRSQTLTTVFAPGALITGAGLDDTFGDNFRSTLPGTSQAAPHVTGMAVLAQPLAVNELGRRLTPAEFRNLVASTGTVIFDGDANANGIVDGDEEDDNVQNTGLNFRRADMLALGQAIPSLQTVTVTVNQVEGDFDPGPDDSDFYSILTIGDKRDESGEITGNDISPNWQLTKGDITTSTVPITIEIGENDGGFRAGTDNIDINPSEGNKVLNLIFDLVTGNITDANTGRLYGLRGQPIILEGDGEDDDKGKIKFTVNGFGVSQPTSPPVGVMIHRIRGDFDGIFNASDFYTTVSVAGVKQISGSLSSDNDLLPELNFIQSTTDTVVPITISIVDEDSLNSDDEVDINPSAGSKSLDLLYNQKTGAITDNVTKQEYGTRGRLIRVQGAGDGDEGEIWFSVYGPRQA